MHPRLFLFQHGPFGMVCRHILQSHSNSCSIAVSYDKPDLFFKGRDSSGLILDCSAAATTSDQTSRRAWLGMTIRVKTRVLLWKADKNETWDDYNLGCQVNYNVGLWQCVCCTGVFRKQLEKEKQKNRFAQTVNWTLQLECGYNTITDDSYRWVSTKNPTITTCDDGPNLKFAVVAAHVLICLKIVASCVPLDVIVTKGGSAWNSFFWTLWLGHGENIPLIHGAERPPRIRYPWWGS
jgi:hypothetical protein